MYLKQLILFLALSAIPFTVAAADTAEKESKSMLKAGEWEIMMQTKGDGDPVEFKMNKCMGAAEASSQLGMYAPNYGNQGSFESNDGDCKMKFNADKGKALMESSCKDGNSSRVEASYTDVSYRVEVSSTSGNESSQTTITGRRIGDCKTND